MRLNFVCVKENPQRKRTIIKTVFCVTLMERAACFGWHKYFKDSPKNCELQGGSSASITTLTEKKNCQQ